MPISSDTSAPGVEARRQAVRDKVPCPECGAASGAPCQSPGGYIRRANHMARLELAGLDVTQIRKSIGNAKANAKKRQRARAARRATPGGW